MTLRARLSRSLPGVIAAVSVSLAWAGLSALERTSEAIADQPDRPLAFRNADDQLFVLDEPGKLYLLDFVAVGCKPCVEELPDLERLQQELGSSDRFQLVTVVYGWRGKALSTLGTSLRSGSLPLYGDTEGCGELLKVQGWPTKFLIRNGRILLRSVGGGAGAYGKWRKIIKRELKVSATDDASVSPPNYRLNPPVGPVTGRAAARPVTVPPAG